MSQKVYLDRKIGRLVDESVVRFEFEVYINEPWFRESYERFVAQNFTLVKEEDVIVMEKTYGKVSRYAA